MSATQNNNEASTSADKSVPADWSIRDATEAFGEPESDSLIDFIRPDGRSCIEGETLEEVRKRYPRAEVVSIAEHCKAKAARQDTPVIWSEVSEERYFEMLEVLPPAIMTARGFLVGEPWDHHALTGAPRFAAFINKGGKHYEASRPLTVKEFRHV